MYFLKSKKVTIILLTLLQLAVFSELVFGQAGLSTQNLSSINVDELSDDQIRDFIRQAEKSGFTEQELEMAARARGMKASEISKLRSRVNKLSQSTSAVVVETEGTDPLLKAHDDHEISLEKIKEEAKAYKGNEVSEKIFGYSLFNLKSLTFEPSINIPTPKNYQLGAGDEIVIDIWGASQQNYRQVISREGSVNIPGLGPIYLNGLTVDQASTRIIGRLSSIYSGLKAESGREANTFAQVSLGRVRSIKVSLVGEVTKPGTYTLPSLSTVFNALYVSGGPSINGSFRNIEVWRENKQVAVLDVYDFLVHGDQKNNIRLQDQDIVRVTPYKKRVSVNGEVKRTGMFEMKEGEGILDLFNFAGGFSDQAYTHRVKIRRNTDKERKIVDVLINDASKVELQNGDVVMVQPILDRFENRVEITGAVFREGEYELTEGLTVGQLIRNAEGLRGDAHLSRATIYRTRDDFTIEVIPFDLQKVLNEEVVDVKLEREDLIRISSIYDLKDKYNVSISGEVHNTGTYPFMENLTLEDLIVSAGGFTESASIDRIEVARRVKNADPRSLTGKIAEVFYFDVARDLSFKGSDSKFVLQPFDHVYVRRSPGYEVQHNVVILGEVLYPGKYAISDKDERISDLINRAGGFTAEAYLPGARLKRSIANTGIVDLNLSKILKAPKSEEDLLLMEGDTLRIPLKLQTVKIRGEVLYPRSTRYVSNRGFRGYISQVGGFNKEALKRKSYIIYANGEVARTKNFIFFKDYPHVEPGAEIVVPQKTEKRQQTAQEVIGIGSGLATMGLIIINILSRF